MGRPVGRRRLSLLGIAAVASVLLPAVAPAVPAQPSRPASRYDTLLKQLEGILRDLENFDAIVAAPGAATVAVTPPRLPAPPVLAVPKGSGSVTVRQQVRLSLSQAVALAVTNSPDLAQSVAQVERERAMLRAAWGRYAPTLSLSLGAIGGQQLVRNEALIGNTSIYAASSPFLVETGGWKQGLFNSGAGLFNLSGEYALLDFSRGPLLDAARSRLDANSQSYADTLRQLQLSISESYYAIQLSELRKRIRIAEVFNNEAVREQASALHRSGLVPRVDVLRAEAALQQSRFKLAQEEATLLSNQRALSNLVNVPFDVTLLATDSVQLQPSWPLDLPETLSAGFNNNPQLRAIEAARAALLRQADAQAAALLPSLSVYVSAQLGQSTVADTDRRSNGCCGAAIIPELSTGSVGWSAGLQLHWKLMDGGVSRGLAEASRADAASTAQRQAQERNAIRQRLEQAFFSHRASLTQVIAARASLKAAREAFRDMRARYQLGLSDYTDVSDSIVSLTQAMEQKATAITLANISYAQMLRDLLQVPATPEQPVQLPITLPAPQASQQPPG